MGQRKLIPYAGKEKIIHGKVSGPADVDRFKRKRILRMLDDGIEIDRIATRWGVPKKIIRQIAGLEEPK